jgi:adenylate kinase family enzyme
MKYKKIHIIGGPGSGKSYLAKKLSERYSIPCYDLDDIFWDKNQREYIRTPEEARQKKLSTILKNDSWIIEGVYYKWLADSFEDADKIVVLNTPVMLRQWRILRRYLNLKLSFGHRKEETFANLIEMFLWNKKYDADTLAKFFAVAKQQAHKITVCSSEIEVIDVLDR